MIVHLLSQKIFVTLYIHAVPNLLFTIRLSFSYTSMLSIIIKSASLFLLIFCFNSAWYQDQTILVVNLPDTRQNNTMKRGGRCNHALGVRGNL